MNNGNTTMTTFEVGTSYATRSICDWDCIFRVTILRRTAKTVTISVHGREVSRRVFDCNGFEAIRPFGNYSMAAVITAEPKDRALAQAA